MRKLNISLLLLFPLLAFAQPVIVEDFSPGTASSFPTWMQEDFGYLDGKILLAIEDAELGSELGIIENESISILKDILPGAASSGPSNFTLINQEVFFTIEDDATNTDQLWKSDGTAAGTVLVHSFEDGYGLSNLIASDLGVLFLQHRFDYYSYDGTEMKMVGESIIPGDDWLHASPVICKYQDGVAFVHSNSSGVNLYYTEGDEVEVLGSMSGSTGSTFTYQASGISPSKGGLTFGRNATDWGITLNFFYNESTGEIEELGFDGFVKRYLDLNDEKEIFFASNDGFYVLEGNDYEKIRDSDLSIAQGEPIYHAAYNDKMIFENATGSFADAEFIFTDGTAAGTIPLMTTGESDVKSLYSNDQYAFISVGSFSPEIWMIDLEAQTFELLYEFPDGDGRIEIIGKIDNNLYFIGQQDDATGAEVYRLPLSSQPTSTEKINPNFNGLITFYADGFEVKTKDQQNLQVNIIDQTGRVLSNITTETNCVHKNTHGSGQYFIQFILDGEQTSKSHYFFR